MQKSLAIVLQIIEFSETSCVVTLFTRDFGKITGLAKGARRKNSPFESALDLLSTVRLVFLPKSPRAMDLLTEAKLERRFRSAATDLPRLYRAYYVAELVSLLIEHNDPMPDVFELTERTLRRLDEPCDADSVLLWFELQLLRHLGHRPQFDQCVGCGRQRIGDAARVYFGLIAGGVLCPRCRSGQRHVLQVHSESIDELKRIADSRESNGGAHITPRVAAESRELMNQYVAHLAGKQPRLQAFLKPAKESFFKTKRQAVVAPEDNDTDVERTK